MDVLLFVQMQSTVCPSIRIALVLPCQLVSGTSRSQFHITAAQNAQKFLMIVPARTILMLWASRMYAEVV